MQKARILVVDDEEDIRQLMKQSLTSRGYEVLLASCGRDGLNMALTENPDLVILDVEMPDMSGIQVCQDIRRQVFAPVIFVSERSDVADIVFGLGVGADHYISKPLRACELLAYVNASIRRETLYSQKRKELQQISIGELTLDLLAYELRKNGTLISLKCRASTHARTASRRCMGIECRWNFLTHG